MKEDNRNESEGWDQRLTDGAVYQGCLQQSHRYDDFAVRKGFITVAMISLPGKKIPGRCNENVFLQQSHRNDDFAVRKQNITVAMISLPGKKIPGLCNETFPYSKVIVTMALL